MGVDPGASGGIAIVSRDDYQAFRMPDTDRDVLDLLIDLSVRPRMAMIERVSAMPKQGIASTFKFGVNYGGLLMALVAIKIPFELVSPVVWQREFSLPTLKKSGAYSVKKRAHRARAQELFPKIKVTNAIADALLIAEFCRRMHS